MNPILAATAIATSGRSPWPGTIGTGMPIVTYQRMDGILELVRANLPRPVESDGDFADWNVVAPAFIAIAADLLEGILSLNPPFLWLGSVRVGE